MHGANRLGGNSLSDLLVFGERAGEFAAAHAAEQDDASPRSTRTRSTTRPASSLAPFDPAEGENPYAIHETSGR